MLDRFKVKAEEKVKEVVAEKTKNAVIEHVSKNRMAYILGGLGILGTLVGHGLGTRPIRMTNSDVIQGIAIKSPVTIDRSLRVVVNAIGDPGNVIQDLTTGIIYASQGQAARALGVNPSVVSRHLNGKIPDVAGHIFKVLGKANIA